MSYLENQKTELAQAQVTEALLRMKKLNLHKNVINEFKRNGKLNKSENLPIFIEGIGAKVAPVLNWLDEEEEKMVREWEQETGNIVYHVVLNKLEFGVCYSFLYVSKHTDEWEYDNMDMENGCPIVYVKNVTYDDCSEYGSIGIKPFVGGVLRTA